MDQSSVVLQMTVQFILDKFLQFSLKLRNELLLPAIKDEINKDNNIWRNQKKYHYTTLLPILYLV